MSGWVPSTHEITSTTGIVEDIGDLIGEFNSSDDQSAHTQEFDIYDTGISLSRPKTLNEEDISHVHVKHDEIWGTWRSKRRKVRSEDRKEGIELCDHESVERLSDPEDGASSVPNHREESMGYAIGVEIEQFSEGLGIPVSQTQVDSSSATNRSQWIEEHLTRLESSDASLVRSAGKGMFSKRLSEIRIARGHKFRFSRESFSAKVISILPMRHEFIVAKCVLVANNTTVEIPNQFMMLYSGESKEFTEAETFKIHHPFMLVDMNPKAKEEFAPDGGVSPNSSTSFILLAYILST